jgi:hypothetical protein
VLQTTVVVCQGLIMKPLPTQSPDREMAVPQ